MLLPLDDHLDNMIRCSYEAIWRYSGTEVCKIISWMAMQGKVDWRFRHGDTPKRRWNCSLEGCIFSHVILVCVYYANRTLGGEGHDVDDLGSIYIYIYICRQIQAAAARRFNRNEMLTWLCFKCTCVRYCYVSKQYMHETIYQRKHNKPVLKIYQNMYEYIKKNIYTNIYKYAQTYTNIYKCVPYIYIYIYTKNWKK